MALDNQVNPITAISALVPSRKPNDRWEEKSERQEQKSQFKSGLNKDRFQQFQTTMKQEVEELQNRQKRPKKEKRPSMKVEGEITKKDIVDATISEMAAKYNKGRYVDKSKEELEK